jgi:hypothetical protein
MANRLPPESESHPSFHCPDCGQESGPMDILLFMDIQLEGYVCRNCRGFYAQIEGELKRLATVIG